VTIGSSTGTDDCTRTDASASGVDFWVLTRTAPGETWLSP
jgi:hypothetical protein